MTSWTWHCHDAEASSNLQAALRLCRTLTEALTNLSLFGMLESQIQFWDRWRNVGVSGSESAVAAGLSQTSEVLSSLLEKGQFLARQA